MKIDKIDSIIGIDHIGYAVNDIDSAKKIFNAIGYEFSETRADDLRKVNACLGVYSGGG